MLVTILVRLLIITQVFQKEKSTYPLKKVVLSTFSVDNLWISRGYLDFSPFVDMVDKVDKSPLLRRKTTFATNEKSTAPKRLWIVFFFFFRKICG